MTLFTLLSFLQWLGLTRDLAQLRLSHDVSVCLVCSCDYSLCRFPQRYLHPHFTVCFGISRMFPNTLQFILPQMDELNQLIFNVLYFHSFSHVHWSFVYVMLQSDFSATTSVKCLMSLSFFFFFFSQQGHKFLIMCFVENIYLSKFSRSIYLMS